MKGQNEWLTEITKKTVMQKYEQSRCVRAAGQIKRCVIVAKERGRCDRVFNIDPPV